MKGRCLRPLDHGAILDCGLIYSGRNLFLLNRQCPIFPGSRPPSIFGAGELNFCVRDGYRWVLSAIITGFLARLFHDILCQLFVPLSLHTSVCASFVSRASSSIIKNPSQSLFSFPTFSTGTMKNLPFSLTSYRIILLLVKFSID